MKPANLHIITDAPYSDWYVEKCLLYAPDTENEFVCFCDNPRYNTHAAIRTVSPDTESMEAFASEADGRYAKVIVQYFGYHAAFVINRIPAPVSIIWAVWGGDLYYLPKAANKNYDPFSRSYVRKKDRAKRGNWKGQIKWFLSSALRPKTDESLREIYRAMARVDYCATLIRQDVELVQKRLNPRVQWIKFALLGTDDLGLSEGTPSETVLWLGNSADPSNNHFEALLKIRESGYRGKMYCPLSYGDAGYAERLCQKAADLFPEGQFVPLRTFMPREEYHRLQNSVGFAIMPHNRQQAFGNLVYLLHNGCKVFLKQKNTLYQAFRDWGITVYNIEEHLNGKELSVLPDSDTRTRNQKIIHGYLCAEKMQEYYRNILI